MAEHYEAHSNRDGLIFTYDAAGNIMMILDGTNSNQKQCFGYDVLNLLFYNARWYDVKQVLAS
jgi:hypothetical protein